MRRQRGSGVGGASDWQLLQTIIIYSNKHHGISMHPLATRGSRQIVVGVAGCISRPPQRHGAVGASGRAKSRLTRSEEHTSELQSLMRISYAVFCLKKKKT